MERRFSCDEVAEMYGVKTLTVWGWIREKKLPAVKIGKAYVVRPEDIKTFEAARVTV